jgi:hypothetical protein
MPNKQSEEERRLNDRNRKNERRGPALRTARACLNANAKGPNRERKVLNS